MKKKLCVSVFYFFIILSRTVLAAEEIQLENPFKFSGYVDGSYNHLLRQNQFVSGVNDRVYDLEPNGFTLQQAAITLSYQPVEGVGGLLNIIGGRDAITIASYGFKPLSEFDSQTFAFDFTQAYLQYAINQFTLMAGRFTAITGAEGVNPTLDSNFSRSILYGYAQPTTVTGMRTHYVLNNKINLILGINDGWDNIRDWGRRETLEYGLSYAVNSIFSFSLQGYNGQERATSATSEGPEGLRNLIDFVSTLQATEKLTFVVNLDYGWQTRAALPDGNLGEAVWLGAAGYAHYKLNEKWQTTVRTEILSDRNGYRTGVRQCWKEATLSVGYNPIKNLMVRPETRYDFSNVASFQNKGSSQTRKNQYSYAVEAYYTFG